MAIGGIPLPAEEFNPINKLFNKGRVEVGNQNLAVSELQKAIQAHNLVSPQVADEVRKILKKELKKDPNQDMVDSALFGISLTMIFHKDEQGREKLDPDLKRKLQLFDALSPNAQKAIAETLSKGSKKQVDPNHKIVGMDMDEIALKTLENPDLLYNW